jgi:hypothetical protein
MSKKLIAIASAAALALTGLVSAPASATSLTVSEPTNTKSTAYEHQVPETNELEKSVTTYRFDVTAEDENQLISFAGSEGVKFVIEADYTAAEDAELDFPEISAGRTSYSKTLEEVGDVVSVYAFTTSTTAGKLTITSGDNRNVYWVKGLVGAAYNMTVTFPTSIPTTGTGAKIKAVFSDVFGNAITGTNAGADPTYSGFENDMDGTDVATITTVGTTFGSADDWTYSSTKKAWESGAILAAESGSVALRVDLTSDDSAAPYAVADFTDYGFKAGKSSAFSSVSAQSLEDQVASLTAKLANTVSKAKYNNLVVKYNKITRGKKAKLVK